MSLYQLIRQLLYVTNGYVEFVGAKRIFPLEGLERYTMGVNLVSG